MERRSKVDMVRRKEKRRKGRWVTRDRKIKE